MKASITILLFLSSLTIYAQKKLVGCYERKWSAHSSLTIFPDSSFEEKYFSSGFTCGMYRSVFKDSIFRGTWKVTRKNILELKFNQTDHDKGWDVSRYYIDTSSQQLIQVGIKNADFLNYIKTKEYDDAGNIVWELNPHDLISSFEALPFNKEQSKRNQLIYLLDFWVKTRSHANINTDFDYQLMEVTYASPFPLINQLYFIGQLKHVLSNPADTSMADQKKAGLKAIITAYISELHKKYKSKPLEELVLMDANGKLEEYIKSKLH